MINKPNTVLVASTVDSTDTSIDTLGALVVIDAEKGTLVADVADLSGVNSIQFGVIKEAKVTTGHVSQKHPAYIAKTKAFTRDELRDIRLTEGAAGAEDTFTLTFPASYPTFVDGDILHVRLNFKVDGHVTQKAEEYAFDLTQYTASSALATAIGDKINGNIDSWVTAVVVDKVITITAKNAIDYQPNAKSINSTIKFNQVEFDLASFRVNGTSFYYSFGTVAKTANATPGYGNPYVVRDQEKDAFGYLGAMHSTLYPNIQPASSVAASAGLVDSSKLYDTISFTAELKYRAPDESYMKSTGVTAQMYYVHTDPNLAQAELIVAAVKLWAGMTLGLPDQIGIY